MMNNSLCILEESLVKKEDVLKRLKPILERQYVILQGEEVDLEAFDLCVEEQDKLIEEINILDADFDSLFEQVKEELEQDKQTHVEQVKRLQQLNRSVQELSLFLQQKETQNKEMLTQFFQSEKMNFGAGRRSSKAAYDYYKSMSQSNVVPPQFMDKKK